MSHFFKYQNLYLTQNLQLTHRIPFLEECLRVSNGSEIEENHTGSQVDLKFVQKINFGEYILQIHLFACKLITHAENFSRELIFLRGCHNTCQVDAIMAVISI